MSEEVPRSSDLRLEDAVYLVHLVKLKFRWQPQHYRSFVNTLDDYKRRRIGPDEVVNRVNVLFRGHPDLLEMFSSWLPYGYRVEPRIVPISDEDDSGVEE